MIIQPVSSILNAIGLREPELDALVGDASKYKVMMLQPQGNLRADITGVRSYDNQLASQQFNGFLSQAYQTQPDLVITPEYAMPWDSLTQALFQGLGPSPRKIWVFGCEGLRCGELPDLKVRFAESGIELLYENLPASDDNKFVSPVCYVFVAQPTIYNHLSRTVVLVQFKTNPMGGTEYERDGMFSGKLVYKFGGNGGISLLTLVCADALIFDDAHANACYDRALILHLQLNPSPRHHTFYACRYRLLQFAGDETEIICLNWAKSVRICQNGQWIDWDRESPAAVPNSAWYLKSKQCDVGDASINTNHQLGLYYTWSESLKSHALLLNYHAAIYFVEATKVAHRGVVAPASRRTGPKLKRTLVWRTQAAAWEEQITTDDGFGTIASHSRGAAGQLQIAYTRGALEVERLLALGAGRIEGPQWYSPTKLDACILGRDEAVRRVTFALDTQQDAVSFRETRLRLCAGLWNILNSSNPLPRALSDLKDGFTLTWKSSFPHQNVVSASNNPATVIYVGEDISAEAAAKVFQKLANFLETTPGSNNTHRNALQRLAVWRRNTSGELIQVEPDKYTRFDQADIKEAVSITRD